MPTFRTSEELTLLYAVTAERLVAYAARGNLAMRRRDGALHFDEANVARLFPRLGESRCAPQPQAGLGTLGRVRLGAPPAAAE